MVAAQQLLKIQDIHYGFWEKGESPSIDKFFSAQEKHTRFLFSQLEAAMGLDKSGKILDVGCGIGITTRKLLAAGYRVDGLVPSAWMARQANANIAPYKDGTRGRIYECKIEDFKGPDQNEEKYDLVFFSESFQYVHLQSAFEVLTRILSQTGKIVIFDFFKKDNVPGKSPMGGGRYIGQFFNTVKQFGFTIETDIDVTENLSPNLTLVNDLLVDRVLPFTQTLDAFLFTRYGFLFRLLKRVFKRKLAKLSYKYSKHRNAQNFAKYKTYRLFILKRD